MMYVALLIQRRQQQRIIKVIPMIIKRLVSVSSGHSACPTSFTFVSGMTHDARHDRWLCAEIDHFLSLAGLAHCPPSQSSLMVGRIAREATGHGGAAGRSQQSGEESLRNTKLSVRCLLAEP